MCRSKKAEALRTPIGHFHRRHDQTPTSDNSFTTEEESLSASGKNMVGDK
jgi:hypothetical protein